LIISITEGRGARAEGEEGLLLLLVEFVVFVAEADEWL